MTKYIIAVAVGAVLASFSSQAATKFKDSSVLSSGKWVKIKVGETGVYEITGEQLKQFGFSDPKKSEDFRHWWHPDHRQLQQRLYRRP